jgi:hypothetical protein
MYGFPNVGPSPEWPLTVRLAALQGSPSKGRGYRYADVVERAIPTYPAPDVEYERDCSSWFDRLPTLKTPGEPPE